MGQVPVCQICNQTEEWHVEHGVKHAFSPDSTRFRLAEPKAPQKVTLPGDPVLRMVLMRKGLITADDMASVEGELKNAGIITSDVVDKSGGDEEPVADRLATRSARSMRAHPAGGSAVSDRASEHKRKSS